MRTSSPRPSAFLRISSWWENGAYSSARSTPSTPAAAPAASVLVEVVRSRAESEIGSIRCSKPVIHAVVPCDCAVVALSAAAMTMAAAPSLTGAQSQRRSGSAYTGWPSASSTDVSPLRIAHSLPAASVIDRATDLGHRLLVPQARARCPSRACRPAIDTASGHRGVAVYGSSWSVIVRRRVPAEALPKPYTTALSTSPVWIFTQAS